jgi:hypothetical protein
VGSGVRAALACLLLSLLLLGAGRTLHARLKTAAERGGGWIRYAWLRVSNATLSNAFEWKLAYAVQVVRDGNYYYLAVGMGDANWPSPPCSQLYASACAEDAAMAVTGSISSLILDADEAGARVSSDALQNGSVLSLPPLGSFGAHVHTLALAVGAQASCVSSGAVVLASNSTVVADGLAPTFRGATVAEWLTKVRLPEHIFDDASASGQWAGPVSMSPMGDADLPTDHLIFFSAVSTDDAGDGVIDGEGATYA